jgi:hypothetical protein
MKDRVEGTNMPKITTYRTFDAPPILPPRVTPQRATQLPIAEVAPTPKSNDINHSSSTEKLAVDIQPPTSFKGLKKIESLRMSPESPEFNYVRYENIFYTDSDLHSVSIDLFDLNFSIKMLFIPGKNLFVLHHYDVKSDKLQSQ